MTCPSEKEEIVIHPVPLLEMVRAWVGSFCQRRPPGRHTRITRPERPSGLVANKHFSSASVRTREESPSPSRLLGKKTFGGSLRRTETYTSRRGRSSTAPLCRLLLAPPVEFVNDDGRDPLVGGVDRFPSAKGTAVTVEVNLHPFVQGVSLEDH